MKKLINLIKEILVYHDFKPSISMWFIEDKDESKHFWLTEQTYYIGTYFRSGYFIFINTGIGKKHGLCIKIIWWKLDAFKPLKKK